MLFIFSGLQEGIINNQATPKTKTTAYICIKILIENCIGFFRLICDQGFSRKLFYH